MSKGKAVLGLIQCSCTADVSENISNAIEKIKIAASKGAQIILLQELFNTLYFCQKIDETYFELAEPVPGKISERLRHLAKELGVVIVAPLFEKRAAGIYHNSLIVIDTDGTLMGTYRKNHIPDDPGFYEKYYFTPGDGTYKVFETEYGKIAPLICWDQWYPEAARIAALQGADLLVYPTAIGTLSAEDEPTKHRFLDAWQTIQKSHAIANGCFVASINRVGREDDITFWGHSFVAGPFGEMQTEAGEDEEILISEIDLSRIEKQRREWPFFRDRRVDSYGSILNRYIDNE